MASLRIPVIPALLLFLALAMLIPAIYGAHQGEWRIARQFLHSSIFTAVSGIVIAYLMPARREVSARRELSGLLLCWLLVPAFAAIPVRSLEPALGFSGSWVEMVLCFTTTGGSLFGDPTPVPDAVHLWRGIVGWLGGLVTLMAAFVILMPQKIGAGEGDATDPRRDGSAKARRMDDQTTELGALALPFEARANRAMRTLLPVYVGLTALLGVLLAVTGEAGLSSGIHAMSVMATSGISPDPSGIAGADNLLLEIAVAVFMVLAATRISYSPGGMKGKARRFRADPEIRIMLWMVGLATCALLGRHWLHPLITGESEDLLEGFAVLWGAFFTTLSFMTTTGYQSAFWETSSAWSASGNPELLLLGLCAVGGGAATTAGGIKLIRIYALIRHGTREVRRIALSNSVIGSGKGLRLITRQDAVIAWTFVMLHFIALMIVVLGLTANGMSFENALVGATAAISNTGPIFSIISSDRLTFADLDHGARMIVAFAAIVGRVEMLALVAIFNIEALRQSFRGVKSQF